MGGELSDPREPSRPPSDDASFLYELAEMIGRGESDEVLAARIRTLPESQRAYAQAFLVGLVVGRVDGVRRADGAAATAMVKGRKKPDDEDHFCEPVVGWPRITLFFEDVLKVAMMHWPGTNRVVGMHLRRIVNAADPLPTTREVSRYLCWCSTGRADRTVPLPSEWESMSLEDACDVDTFRWWLPLERADHARRLAAKEVQRLLPSSSPTSPSSPSSPASSSLAVVPARARARFNQRRSA